MFLRVTETTKAVSRSVLLICALCVAYGPSLSLGSDSADHSSSRNNHSSSLETASTEPVFQKPVPENVSDLLAIQKRVIKISKKLQDCTVGVRSESTQGSGVIVTADGYILTAAHVVTWLSQDVKIYFNDGRVVAAKVLGTNSVLDMALLKIKEKGQWPFAEMSSAKEINAGQWSLAVGHPGGFEIDRLPVLRLGRISSVSETILQSDCSLNKGDSGGPLFDLNGKVVGIHSRIGSAVNRNFHIPVSVYRSAWESLTQQPQEVQSKPTKKASPLQKPTALLGVFGETTKQGCKIVALIRNRPAAAAGFKLGDVITNFGNERTSSFRQLREQVFKRLPGDKVKVTVLRQEKNMIITVILADKNQDSAPPIPETE